MKLMIDGIPVLAYTPEALLGIVIMLILVGQLQTRWQQRDKDRYVAKIEEQLVVKDEQIKEQAKQLAVLSDVGETVNRVLGAVQAGSMRHQSEVPPE